MQRADGAWVWMRNIVGAPQPGATMVTGVLLDITEQRRLELDLRQAQKLESVGRLASGIAHEINTPVQFIGDIHFVRGAFDDATPLWAKVQELRAAAASGAPTADLLSELNAAEEAADVEFLAEQVPKALDRALE